MNIQKQYLASCLGIAVFLLTAQPIRAVTTSMATTSSPKTVKEMREEVKELRKDFREEVKEKVQEIRQTVRDGIAERHANRLEARFALYNKQLTNIATRIQTRIDTEKSEGKDVTKAQNSLNQGKTTLAKAVEDGKKAVQAFKDITAQEWDKQKADTKAAIELAQTARLEFVEARKFMIEAVIALKTN